MLERTLNFGDLSVKKKMTPFEDIESLDLSLEEECFLGRSLKFYEAESLSISNQKTNIIECVHIKNILTMVGKWSLFYAIPDKSSLSGACLHRVKENQTKFSKSVTFWKLHTQRS
jgi:CBS domain containing-hemolysin-like protein